MQTNKKQVTRAFEGGKAQKPRSPEQLLRRLVLTCMLFEKTFYVDGKDIVSQIVDTARRCDMKFVADLAIEARKKFYIRHAPLMLLLALIERRYERADTTIAEVISRPDEITELVSLYWKDGKKSIAWSMKRGLAAAMNKFDAHAFAKYNRDTPVKFRDVLFLTHAKAKDAAHQEIFNHLTNRTLPSPDTWEVQLCAGKDKKTVWESLLREEKLGYMALLKNLRNMEGVSVDRDLVAKAILARRGANTVLPFRYVAAYRNSRQWATELEMAAQAALSEADKFPGTTNVLVDVSGSMVKPMSDKADLSYIDAAASLAMMINGDLVRTFTFSSHVVEVKDAHGLSGIDKVVNSQNHGGTRMGHAISSISHHPCDRMIIITDEQSYDKVPTPVSPRSYIINVAPYKQGVRFDSYIHIDGFSESVLRYITELEQWDL